MLPPGERRSATSTTAFSRSRSRPTAAASSTASGSRTGRGTRVDPWRPRPTFDAGTSCSRSERGPMSAKGSRRSCRLLGIPDLISFAGGFPDPTTFPRERASALLDEFAVSGEANAFQYAPTRGLAGPLDALAGRLESTQGRRPDDDELLITSGAIEGARARRQVVPRPRRPRRRRGADVPRRDHGLPRLRGRDRRRADGRARAARRRARAVDSQGVCARSSSTRSRTTRTRPA